MKEVVTRMILDLFVPFKSWLYDFKRNSLSGSGSIADFEISSLIGTIDAVYLELIHHNCPAISKPLGLSQIEECKDYELEFIVNEIRIHEQPFIYFEIYSLIENNSPFDLNIQLSVARGNDFFHLFLSYCPSYKKCIFQSIAIYTTKPFL